MPCALVVALDELRLSASLSRLSGSLLPYKPPWRSTGHAERGSVSPGGVTILLPSIHSILFHRTPIGKATRIKRQVL